MRSPSTAAVSGASGYIGSQVCQALERRGWKVLRLSRDPRGDQVLARRFDLDRSFAPTELESVDVLVHAAYDMSLTRRQDILRVNVEGSRRLLRAAHEAGVPNVLVLSSLSAFEGTKQLYGMAKLQIEGVAASFGACSIRPGLVYGGRPGGMFGSLRKVAKLPVIPMPAGHAEQYPVHIDDLMSVITALSEMDSLPLGPVPVAQPTPVSFREILLALAARDGRHPRVVPVPWRAAYWALRAGEAAHLKLPFRSDSLLGLVQTTPQVPDGSIVRTLGIPLRMFGEQHAEEAEHRGG